MFSEAVLTLPATDFAVTRAALATAFKLLGSSGSREADGGDAG